MAFIRLMPDPQVLYDQFKQNAIYDASQIVDDINSAGGHVDQALVDSRNVQSLLASICVMFNCSIGTDSNGDFAVSQERLTDMGNFLQAQLERIGASTRAHQNRIDA